MTWTVGATLSTSLAIDVRSASDTSSIDSEITEVSAREDTFVASVFE